MNPDLNLVFGKVKALFPEAVSMDPPDPNLKTPPSFFLREGVNLLWVEIALDPFSQNELSGYLAKARKIEKAFPQGVRGILAAPDFEASVQEILELIRIPVRLFCYREWSIEELTGGEIPIEPPSAGLRSSWIRLSRPELQEFIQLELDVASFYQK